ncbi:GUN4 domain-containing protein [Cylindrospermopsis sp. CR12]|uniref:GUN4 domain-containing protein n=1 Tax=Cylindrospermopsis sp. CR12 TaxID=1747196 RepID=UPI00092F69B2|nr:GUN4 domain-containing protein [Cylindrospermopsis sp. CR12]
MKLKKLTELVIISILITVITILQPVVTLALTSAQIAAIATQITVRITGADKGSGVIISRSGNTYTVLTNNHVFKNPGNYEVTTPDRRKYQVTNIRRIENLDLATFQFNSTEKYNIVKQGNSRQMTIGKAVYVSGFPADKGLNFLRSEISRIDPPGKGGYSLVYRIGAFPAMSGGPILNEDGKLVGIHGKTESIPISIYDSTPEEYGIPLQTFLNAPPPTPSRYTRLETLLKAQDFREADLEIDRVMLAVANRQSQGWLRVEDAENFPCQELRTIDNLWLKYSQGKFGISVQQEIYKNLGGTKQFDVNVWISFGDRVGWRKQGSWLEYKDLNFSLSAPTGQLPFAASRGKRFYFPGGGTSLLSRHVECNP